MHPENISNICRHHAGEMAKMKHDGNLEPSTTFLLPIFLPFVKNKLLRVQLSRLGLLAWHKFKYFLRSGYMSSLAECSRSQVNTTVTFIWQLHYVWKGYLISYVLEY